MRKTVFFFSLFVLSSALSPGLWGQEVSPWDTAFNLLDKIELGLSEAVSENNSLRNSLTTATLNLKDLERQLQMMSEAHTDLRNESAWLWNQQQEMFDSYELSLKASEKSTLFYKRLSLGLGIGIPVAGLLGILGGFLLSR